MAEYKFQVNLKPKEAFDIIKNNHTASLIYEDYKNVSHDKEIGVLVYEKYYIRNSSRAALTVIIDNIDGATQVASVSTGSSQSMIFKFDWGASDEFASSIQRMLADYII